MKENTPRPDGFGVTFYKKMLGLCQGGADGYGKRLLHGEVRHSPAELWGDDFNPKSSRCKQCEAI